MRASPRPHHPPPLGSTASRHGHEPTHPVASTSPVRDITGGVGSMLGYQANAQWRDMSDFVVHFTKPGAPYHDAYQNMMSILGSRTLIPGAEGFGLSRKEPSVA